LGATARPDGAAPTGLPTQRAVAARPTDPASDVFVLLSYFAFPWIVVRFGRPRHTSALSVSGGTDAGPASRIVWEMLHPQHARQLRSGREVEPANSGGLAASPASAIPTALPPKPRAHCEWPTRRPPLPSPDCSPWGCAISAYQRCQFRYRYLAGRGGSKTSV
jgi:hypothetical protein